MLAGQTPIDLPLWGVKHIHWLAYAPGYKLLVSQFAFEWDPVLEYGEHWAITI